MSLLLRIRDLRTSFFTSDGEVRAVDGVTFDIEAGKTMGLVGESGCGKSVTALSIMQLLSKGVGRIVGGEIVYQGDNLASFGDEQMRAIRGNEISMIFQEPMTSLNPVFTIGEQIAETVSLHQGASKKEARDRAIEMLRLVKIAEPEKRVKDYPHQLSGGMRQRAMIAMALSTRPRLLIADEPTTALDVTIQAQVLDLMKGLVTEYGMAILFITHDLGVIAQTADRVAVMYLGEIIETGSVRQVINMAAHPYTQGLLHALPRLDDLEAPLTPVAGDIPSPLERPPGCVFHTRCPKAIPGRCDVSAPETTTLGEGHSVACFAVSSPAEATA